MKKTILIVLLLAAAITGGYFYLYKGHRSIDSEAADFTITIPQIQQEFSANDSLANQKYLDKTIIVSGKVTTVDQQGNSIIIDEKLTATFGTATAADFSVGKSVKIKGRFIGYDDLLEEFRLDQISIVE